MFVLKFFLAQLLSKFLVLSFSPFCFSHLFYLIRKLLVRCVSSLFQLCFFLVDSSFFVRFIFFLLSDSVFIISFFKFVLYHLFQSRLFFLVCYHLLDRYRLFFSLVPPHSIFFSFIFCWCVFYFCLHRFVIFDLLLFFCIFLIGCRSVLFVFSPPFLMIRCLSFDFLICFCLVRSF